MKLSAIAVLAAATLSTAGCAPRVEMRAVCKVVATPDAASESRFIAAARAFGQARNYAVVVLGRGMDVGTLTATFGARPTLRLVTGRPDRPEAYAAFFYSVPQSYPDDRVRKDAGQFATEGAKVADFHVQPMQSDVTPPLDTGESACARAT